MSKKKLKILILEDNINDAELEIIELKKANFDFEYERVETEFDFIKGLEKNPDIILSDYILPSFSGPEAIKIKNKLRPDIPLIILSGTVGEELTVNCMKAGATDYVLKDKLSRLAPVVSRALLEVEEHSMNLETAKAMQLSEAKYKAIFNNTGTATVILEHETIILVNSEFCHLAGYSKQELEGNMTWKEIFVPEDIQPFEELLITHRIDKSPIANHKFRLLTKDKEIKHIILTANIIPNTIQTIGSMLDITPQNVAETKVNNYIQKIEQLSEAALKFVNFPKDENIYQFIGEQLSSMISQENYIVVSSIDTKTNTLTAQAITGLSSASTKIKDFFQKFNPKDISLLETDIDRMPTDGKLHLYEHGLYGLMLRSAPKVICNTIEKFMGIKQYYTSTFIKDNEIFGTVIFAFKTDRVKIEDRNIIEAFLKQASIAIQKMQIEQRLLESEERFKKLSNLSFEGILIHNNFKILDFNESLVNLFGYSKAAFKNLSSLELCVHKDFIPTVIQNIQKKIAKPYEVIAIKSDGTEFPIEIESKNVTYNGERIRVTAIRDISERRKTEDQLRVSESKFRQIYENMNVGIAQVSLDFSIISANEAYCEMLGYTEKELIGKNLQDITSPEIYEENIKKQEQLANEELEHYRMYKRFIHKEGKIVYGILDANLIRDKYNKPDYFLGSVVDITDRRKAEESLEEAQRIAKIGNWNLDIINNKFTCSDEVYRIFNYQPQEIELNYEKFLEKTHPEDRQFVQNIHENSVKTQKPYDIVHRVLLDNGEIKFVNEHCKTFYGGSQKPTSSIGSIQDVTERIAAEKKIKQSLGEKEILLQEIHHRTKNNMAVVSAMLTMQSRQLKDDKIKTIFKEINNKIKAMSLVHQKLYQSEDLSNIDLKEYIEDLLKLILRSYGMLSKKVTINFELTKIKILIDTAIPLGIVLNELISNIFKHAFPHDNTGEIFIKTYKDDEGYINIHLEDNGVGLPKTIDVKDIHSMGLISIFSIVENQLKGKISIDSNHGMKWHIKVKDNLHQVRI